ncbi:hypothetical protein M3Y97_00825300 [Aphelenchoides bicaudatus]|nr:hypothetical protein M3Y97_00825300 [Aphelenchoides bicaudatus]
MSSTMFLQVLFCGLLVLITVMHANAMPLESSMQSAYANNQFYAPAMPKRAINPFIDSIGKRSPGGTRHPIYRPSSYRRPQRPFEDSWFQQVMLMN